MTCFYALKSQTYIILPMIIPSLPFVTLFTGLLKTLEQDPESAVSCFKQIETIVNADKFQAIILNKKESEAKYKLTIDNNDIESTKSVKLLGITINDRLQFDQHIKFVFQSCNAIKFFRST